MTALPIVLLAALSIILGVALIFCFTALRKSRALAADFQLKHHELDLKHLDTVTALASANGRLSSITSIEQEKARVLQEVNQEKARIQQEKVRLLQDVTQEKTRLENELQVAKQKQAKEVADLESQRKAVSTQLKTLNESIRARTKELTEAEGELDVYHFGFYKSQYDFASSSAYSAQLDVVRGKQKDLLKGKSAATCQIEWTVNGSKVEGKKQTNQLIKLMLRAFNGECDAAVAKVKYNNVLAMETRIKKAFEAINALAQVQQARIVPHFLDLKIQELRLAHEHQEKLQAEREEQKRIREQMREEEQARRELERAKEDAEREETRAQEALEKARREVAIATGERQSKMMAQIGELERRLSEAEQNKQRAISRAQMTRSGYVYIISNIGSFGEHVYKIGMTRRLDPQDRIDELGSASVPFPFDVHAMLFCEDAPSVENALHKAFQARRVNRVNERKEFSKVSINEIEQEARRHNAKFTLTLAAEAKQYRQTVAMIEGGIAPQPINPNFATVVEPSRTAQTTSLRNPFAS